MTLSIYLSSRKFSIDPTNSYLSCVYDFIKERE